MSSVFKRVWARVIAVILVVAIVSGMLVYDRTEIRIDPENAGSDAQSYALRQLIEGSRYLKAGRLQRMGMYVSALLNGKDNADECLLASEIELAGGNYDEALQLLNSALEKWDGTIEEKASLARQCGYICVLLERDDEAARYIENGMKLDEDADGYLVLALLNDDGSGAERVKYVERYLKKRGDMPLDEEAGSIALMTGDFELIERVYTRLYKENPSSENLLCRGYGRYGTGNTEQAVADFNAYRLVNGPEVTTSELLAQNCFRNGDYEGALKLFEEALSMENAEKRGCLYYIALCANKTGDHERAVEAARQCLETGTVSHDVVMVNLPVDENLLARTAGISLAELGEYSQALEQFEKYLAVCPDDAAVMRMRASLIMYDGRWQDALDAMALLDGTDVNVRYMKGVCMYELGDTVGAKAEFEAVVNAETDDIVKEQCRGYLREINTNQLEDKE